MLLFSMERRVSSPDRTIRLRHRHLDREGGRGVNNIPTGNHDEVHGHRVRRLFWLSPPVLSEWGVCIAPSAPVSHLPGRTSAYLNFRDRVHLRPAPENGMYSLLPDICWLKTFGAGQLVHPWE